MKLRDLLTAECIDDRLESVAMELIELLLELEAEYKDSGGESGLMTERITEVLNQEY